MNNMVPLESIPLYSVFSYGGCSSSGGGFTEATLMREATINNQDPSGETCYTKKDDGSASKNDVVSSINIEENGNRDKSWLRLGTGPEENNTASYKVQRCCSKNAGERDNLLELSLFSSSSNAEGAASNSVDHQQPPQTLLNSGFAFPFSKPWIPQYTAPFRVMSERDVTNTNRVTRSWCVEEEGAGPSSEFRVIDPPKRPHSGLWFLLQASQFQEKEPFLPQVNKSYLRIKDGRITVRLLIKYLMKKLQLDRDSEIEIRCRGQQLSPLLTMQHVRDAIWSQKSSLPSSSPSFSLLRDSSTSDYVMILHYGRTA